MDLYKEIIGCTVLAVTCIGLVHHRASKRFDKIDRDHAQLHADLQEEQRIAATTRDNSWYQFSTIRDHLLSIIRWNRK